MCSPRVPLVASCGAENGATEERILSQLQSICHGNCKGRGWIIAFSSLLFEIFFFFFLLPKIFMFYPAGPKFECVLLHASLGMTGPSVPWLCSSGTALCSLGADCAAAPRALWAWAGSSQPLTVSLTFLQCQVPVSASTFPTQGTGQPWQGLLGSDRALWLQSHETGPLQGWLWERMSSVTHQAADKS